MPPVPILSLTANIKTAHTVVLSKGSQNDKMNTIIYNSYLSCDRNDSLCVYTPRV